VLEIHRRRLRSRLLREPVPEPLVVDEVPGCTTSFAIQFSKTCELLYRRLISRFKKLRFGLDRIVVSNRPMSFAERALTVIHGKGTQSGRLCEVHMLLKSSYRAMPASTFWINARILARRRVELGAATRGSAL